MFDPPPKPPFSRNSEKPMDAHEHLETNSGISHIPRNGENRRLEALVVAEGDNDSLISPPAYGESEGRLILAQDGLNTDARVTYDGRVDIKIDTTSRRLSKFLQPVLKSQIDHEDDPPPPFSALSGFTENIPTPELNIVIQLVGSRGDIQPFISLGLVLQNAGHRVRIATHQTFQPFVEDLGLEFFNIGGDPVELMAFMVRNPGLMPSFDNIAKGEVQRKRKAVRRIMEGCWRSCVEAGDGTGSRSPKNAGKPSKDPKPFVADAIIANPPSFAHIHCAEKLGVPLHMMFTMPWTPTQAFAHPLANIQSSNADAKLTNYISYVLVEMMTWQGIGSVINSFRRKTLGLEPIDSTWAPGMVTRLKVPHTYCWSPALIPKPKDWGSHITISGYCFLSLRSSYTPAEELLAFLQNGEPPVYIGFGSIVVDDPPALTATIFKAIELAGVRAIVSQGWGDLGATTAIPSNIFLVGNCPHDWLFDHVSCVVHHGGSGTTSAGISASKPTVVVPFFGDQPFWGNMVARAGAGPPPIPFKLLTAEALAAAISHALMPTVSENARILAAQIKAEQGSETAAKSFHDRLPLAIMGCSLTPQRTAVWQFPRSEMRLSALAATVLRKEGLMDFRSLKLYRTCEYDLNHGPWEPFSGGILAVTDLFYNVFKGFGEIGSDLIRAPSNIDTSRKLRLQDYPTLQSSPNSTRPVSPPSEEDDRRLGVGSVKGAARILKATVRAPMTFTLGMAQGAHNAPKMWGDKTVRPQDNITGLGSGLAAGFKELGFGTYDGIAGLFMQPILGARDEGVLGAIKGFGKGIAGTPVKFFAAMSGIVGYPLKGLDVQITNAFTGRGQNAIVSARMAQGEREYLEISETEKSDIVGRWQARMAGENSEGKGKRKKSGK